MKRFFIKGLLIVIWLISGNAYCQQNNHIRPEQTIDSAYKKAYPACVQLFAYDTVAKQQAGGVFSGVVVKDGYILTAAHVATPGVVYKVHFPDGKTCLAVGLGKIELLQDKTIPDVALIKILSSGTWPFAVIGSSSSLKKDEPCISIAYPESLVQPQPVLRFGYISDVKNERGFIQSTCLMEPGDSGGPLFNCKGEVIGLHSAIEIPEKSNYDVPVDLYIKYHTALTSPKVYTAYPNVVDSVLADQSSKSVISLPTIADYRAFTQADVQFKSSCITITSFVNGKAQKVYGTLFSFPNLGSKHVLYRQAIVSKSSLIGDDAIIATVDQSKIKAKVVARDKENDLVILVPDRELKGGIVYKPSDTVNNIVRPGKLLISSRQDSTGVISITGSFVFSLPKMANAGFLGVGFNSRKAPFNIAHIFPNLNKSIYQLKTGDQLVSINDSTSADLNVYFRMLGKYWPGDTIRLKIKRADSVLTENIVLDTIPQRHINHPAEFFAGGKSYRRDGFKNVFTHDAVIKPMECGGPVFDLDGIFWGINIARYSRASCLAIPANLVYRFINEICVPPTKTKGIRG